MVVIYVSRNALLRGETRLTIIPNYNKERSFRSLLQACFQNTSRCTNRSTVSFSNDDCNVVVFAGACF